MVAKVFENFEAAAVASEDGVGYLSVVRDAQQRLEQKCINAFRILGRR